MVLRRGLANSRCLLPAVVGLAVLLTALVCLAPVAYALLAPPRWVEMPHGQGLVASRTPGMDWTIIVSELPDGFHMSVVRLGWPLRCLVRFSEHAEDQNLPGAVRIHLSYTDSRELIQRVTTYRPVWYGILGDIAFFAAGIGATRWAAHALRVTVRTRRGRCWSCGYSLRGNKTGTCPECGTPKTIHTSRR